MGGGHGEKLASLLMLGGPNTVKRNAHGGEGRGCPPAQKGLGVGSSVWLWSRNLTGGLYGLRIVVILAGHRRVLRRRLSVAMPAPLRGEAWSDCEEPLPCWALCGQKRELHKVVVGEYVVSACPVVWLPR